MKIMCRRCVDEGKPAALLGEREPFDNSAVFPFSPACLEHERQFEEALSEKLGRPWHQALAEELTEYLTLIVLCNPDPPRPTPLLWPSQFAAAQPTCSPTLVHSGSENRARCPVTSALLELRGGHVAERAVRPNRIVVQAPGFDDLARLSQAEEPVLVETLVAEPAVEALDVGILVWLAGLDEVQPDALRVGPRIERAAGELGPIVRDEHRRLPARLDEPLEHLCVHFDRQAG